MRILLLTTLMIITSAASAGLYKWVDNDGNVHYSQKPPRGQQFKKLKAPAPAPEDSKRLYESINLEKKSGNVAEKEEAKNEKIRARNCKIAKQNLKSYQLSRRVRDEDGKVTILDDNERAKQIEMAKKDINKYCK